MEPNSTSESVSNTAPLRAIRFGLGEGQARSTARSEKAAGGLARDLRFILSQRSTDARKAYDRAAPRYEYFRKLWLKLAGSETEKALRRSLAEVLRPGHRVLDAGCGTGTFSPEILRIEPSVRLAALDQSLPMLLQAANLAGRRLAGDVLALPFAGGAFDLVVSDWVIETVPDPRKAVEEYLRVLAPGGYLFCTSARSRRGGGPRWRSLLLREAVRRGFAGRFLTAAQIPRIGGERFRLSRFHDGLSALLVARNVAQA